MGTNLPEVTGQDFEDFIGSETTTLIDFWAEWCGPCRIVAPVLEDIAVQHPEKIKIGKLNIDHHPQPAANYDVMSIPTLIVFKDGVEKKRIIGARPKHALEQELAEFLV